MTDWPQLVRQHGPMVWQTVFRLVNNEADAGDCFQNTFVAALEVSRKEKVRSWPGLLKRLATARALERLRQRYRDAARQTALASDAELDGKHSAPDRAAQAQELAEHLRAALSELDERQAQVFCLACMEELSYQEIAAHLGITVNHVGVLLNRARAALRQRLAAHEPADDAGASTGRFHHE